MRMSSAIPKPLLKLGNKPILLYTLEALAGNSFISRIIIAVNKDNVDKFRWALKGFRTAKQIDFVLGGRTRKESVGNCLRRVSESAELVLVHDAVRPFIDNKLINALIRQALKTKAAIAGVCVKPTVKAVNSHREVTATLDRKNLWEIQTPQVFEKDLLVRAYERFGNLEATDEASLVERLGVKIKVVEGSYFNIKITTPEDLVLAEAIYKERKTHSARRKTNV